MYNNNKQGTCTDKHIKKVLTHHTFNPACLFLMHFRSHGFLKEKEYPKMLSNERTLNQKHELRNPQTAGYTVGCVSYVLKLCGRKISFQHHCLCFLIYRLSIFEKHPPRENIVSKV